MSDMFGIFTEGPDGGALATVAQPEVNKQVGIIKEEMGQYVSDMQDRAATDERNQLKAAAKKIRGRQQSVLAGAGTGPAGHGTGMVDATSTPYPFVTG